MAEKTPPKMFNINNLNELPMPIFKKCIQRDFFHLQKLYIQEEKRLGIGIMLMTIEKEKNMFDVSYLPVDQIPDDMSFKAKLLNKKDSDNFMRIVGVESGRCVTLKLEKQVEPKFDDIVGKVEKEVVSEVSAKKPVE